MPYTTQDLIRIYSRNVANGHSDTDLNPRERRLTSVLLNLASNSGHAVQVYPPTDTSRDLIVHSLGDIIWQARPLIDAVSPASGESFERAITRTIEVLRNI